MQHALVAQLQSGAPGPVFVPRQDWAYEAGPVLTLLHLVNAWGELSVLLAPLLPAAWLLVCLRRRARALLPAGWSLDGAQRLLRPVRQPGVAPLAMSPELGLLAHSGVIELCLPGQAPVGHLSSFYCNTAADRAAVNQLARLLCERYGLRLVGART